MTCPQCGEYLGWYSEHDSRECDRVKAIDRARERLLDALLESDDWETDAAFWSHVLTELERAEAPDLSCPR